MKKCILLLILSCLCIINNLSAQEIVYNAKVYRGMREAMTEPDKVVKLFIECSKTEFSKFAEAAHLFKGVKFLHIFGSDPRANWDILFQRLKYLKSLRELELSYNGLKVVPPGFNNFTKLEKITIRGNAELPPDSLFKHLSVLPELRSLHFEDARIEAVPENISKLEHLRVLKIERNEELDLDGSLQNIGAINNLKELSLKNNNISEFPKSLKKLKNIEVLDLSNNFIYELPKYFKKLKGLKELYLEGNLIADFPHAFQYLKKNNFTFLLADKGITEEETDWLKKRYPECKVEVAGFDSAAYVLSNTLRFYKEEIRESYLINKSYVNPPVKELNVKSNVHKVNPALPANFKYKTGTKIHIPANAFVTQDNEPVTGDVEVYYREFRDPVDFMMAGISMQYDSGGVTHFLESGGMFEITARQYGEELKLAEGKTVKVDFVQTDTLKGYNFYELDEPRRNWQFRGVTDPKKVVVEDTFKVYSDAWKKYRLFVSSYDSEIRFDTSRFQESYQKLTKTWAKVELIQYKLREQGREKFNFSTRTISRFPELSAFAGMKWIFNITEMPKDVNIFNILEKKEKKVANEKQMLINEEYYIELNERKFWNDIRIEYFAGDPYFTIELKDSTRFVKFRAYPILDNKKSTIEDAREEYWKRYSRYETSLMRKEQKYNRAIRKKISDHYAELEKSREKSWSEVQKMMSSEEKAMSTEEWFDYYEEVLKRDNEGLLNVKLNITNFVNSLEVDGFGIWNCDKKRRLENPVIVYAEFQDKHQNKLKPVITYIINKNLNSVFRFDGYQGFTSDKLVFDPFDRNVMIVVLENEKMAMLNEDNLNKMSFENKGNYEFTMTPLNSSFTSVGQLRKEIGLN